MPPSLATGATGPTGIYSEEGPSPKASPTSDATSNENYNESSPLASKVAAAEGKIVEGIRATITEGIITASREVDGAPTTTVKLSSEQEAGGVGDGKQTLGSKEMDVSGIMDARSCVLSSLPSLSNLR